MTPTDPQVPELPTDFRVDYGPLHARMHAYFRDRAKAMAFAAHHSCDGVAAQVVELFERLQA